MRAALRLLVVPLFPVFSILPALANAELRDLLDARRIALQARGTGVHGGEAVRVELRNTTSARVAGRIPAGWVFTSVDEQVQDLLVVRDEPFDLAPGALRTITCRAFCAQGALRGPSEGERYRPGALGAPALVALAQAVAAAPYDDDLVQAAVWAVSNGYSIAGMGALDSTSADTLRLVVARLSGQPPPRYGMRFQYAAGSVCTGRPDVVEQPFRITVGVPTTLNAVVLDRNGRIVHILEDHTMIEPGRYAWRLQVPVADLPPGRYAIHVWTTAHPGVHRLPFTL
jgi:hypothetical protein